MNSKKVTLSVVICTYNRADFLKYVLKDLIEVQKKCKNMEVLVVDNNSSDNTKATVESFKYKFIKYFFLKKQGLSLARNYGIKKSSGKIIAFLDDDVRVKPFWAQAIIEAFNDPEVFAVGGPVKKLLGKGLTFPEWYSTALAAVISVTNLDAKENREMPENIFPIGANMAFRKEVFNDFYFDKMLGRRGEIPLSGEETDLFRKIKAMGKKIIYVPKAEVFHFVSKEKLSKTYFERIAFYNGKSDIIRRKLSKGDRVVLLFYSFLKITFWFGNFILSTKPDKKFLAKFKIIENFGAISELI